jgi:hypothetical protein
MKLACWRSLEKLWLGGRDSSTVALRATADLIVSVSHPPESRLDCGASEGGWLGVRDDFRNCSNRPFGPRNVMKIGVGTE